jgi:hypothetical protein
MGTGKKQAIPSRLESARRRFQRWRRSRKVGARIPEPLWAAAVKLAQAYGIHRTARVLGLDYNSVKQRLEKQSASRPPQRPRTGVAAFVELAASPRMVVEECLLELEDAEGAKMRIHLKGVAAGDLTALSRSLWGID